MNYDLYFDGGSRGNPGPGGCGVSIQIKNTERYNFNKYLKYCTNNIAEYKALKYGLKLAIKLNILNLKVYGDSLLVINQVNGVWRCKNENLKKILDKINILKSKFHFIEFNHVLREKNKRADALVNKAINENI